MSHTTPEASGLDPAMLRDQLFDLWNRKDLQMLHLAALQGFSKLSEPLEALLTILESCPGKQKGRSHTLGHHILMEFQTWIKEHPQVNLSSVSEQQAVALQRRALNLLTDTQPNFVDSLINIYQLNSLDPAILRLHITGLHALNCYKEAATLSIKLNLQEELNMEEMCVPLIVQDKMSVAVSFVSGYSHLEERLVKLLDSWCHPSFCVAELNSQFPRLNLTKQRMEQIQPKMLTKHVLRLMEKFKIDKGLCPNALHKRRLDSLRFLMYKRFVDKGMTEENWIDHVQYVVADDLELQIHLVEMLVRYSCLRKASQWSLRYNIPRYRLPYGVWETQQSLPRALQQISLSDTAETEWESAQSHCEKFYQVPLTKDKVHFVDTPEALERCQSIVLKEGVVVGVDMEWQPTFGCISTQQVALIQLAVSDRVFLVDLCARRFCEHPETIRFIRSLFSQQSVLKLGYGMAGDLKCLLATWPQLQEDPLKMEGMLDLLSIHKKIQHSALSRTHNGPKEVLVGEDCAEKGLSLLVQQVLGRPLDKTEQMSNWEKRPLRISQIRYAVADAYCLLEVYSVVSRNPASFGLPDDLRSISSSQSEMSRDKKLKEKKGKQTKQTLEKEECQGAQRVSPSRSDPEKGVLYGEKPSEDSPPLPPQQLRVVCDNMLQGLGRYLRCLGVDVVMLENTDDHRVAAKACNSDQYVAVPRDDMVGMLKKKGLLPDQDNTDLMHQEEEKHDDILTPKLPRYALQCRWASLSGLDPDTLTFPGGAPIQLHTVPPTLLPRIPLFYICTRCGKVFWEGSHFGRVLSMFQEVLHISDEDNESAAVPITAAQQN
ncbi:exonuclease mut-7 homolog isoform X5 [Oreochromis niloticus]|uniref:exonuclease mut-7 homolog isoform X5 n=1 Tax=Oreochromis niloticus TaxID=8128 RepID=UPI000DF401D6|nr:exonuclease mut-7 homolog isoform X5 [Oreochromis niloticus]